MADVATPSAAAMATNGTVTPPPTKDKPHVAKPERPDEEQFKKELTEADKNLQQSNEKLNAIKAKLDGARPGNKDSPSAKRQQELRNDLATIRQEQAKHKTSRNVLMDRIKRLDEQVKSRIAEQKTARSRVNFKSVEDVDREINRLQSQVDSSTMKLVDEQKALRDISNLQKQRKSFADFDKSQSGIDEIKAQIASLRKELDDPESKALSEKYSGITKELDEIKAGNDEVYKNINSLRDERTKAHADQQEKYAAVRDIKDKYYQAKRACADYEREAYKQRQERKKADREAYEKGKRRQVAEQMLEEARTPAYLDQITTAQGLIRHFDPNSAEAKEQPVGNKFAAQAQRTVNADGMKGTKLMRKDGDENYFVGGGGKKGKKGRNQKENTPPAPTEGKFNLSIDIIEGLAKMGIEPPMNQAGVPAVVEQLRKKLAHWKETQDAKTKENIAKAQKEIDRLEAEASTADEGAKDTARKPAKANQAVDGKVSATAEQDQEKDTVADAAKELQEAKIEDQTKNEEAEAVQA